MRNLLIIDTETTGLDAKEGKVIEIGAIFYNIPTQTITHQVSTLMHAESNPAFDINRISPNALQSVLLENQSAAISMVHFMLVMCDAVVAHNAAFDRGWIESLDESLATVSRKFISIINYEKYKLSYCIYEISSGFSCSQYGEEALQNSVKQ